MKKFILSVSLYLLSLAASAQPEVPTDTIHGIGPDGKAQVTVEYAVNEPEHEDAPLRVSTVVLSVQHAANKIRTSWRRN